MSHSVFIGLVNNTTLLLALGIIYDSLSRRKHLSTSNIYKFSAGFIIGWLAIGLMALPVRWESGIIFDTRTILLGLTGLFFGPIPTGIAMTIASAYRLFIGGNGTLMGVATIVSSGLIGLAWRHYRFDQALEFSLKELYLFGFAIHSTMILLMFLLPDEYIWITINSIALPVIIIYPVATSLLGILLARRNRRLLTEESLQESEDRFRATLEASPIVIWNQDIDLCYTWIHNPHPNFKAEELIGKTDLELLPVADGKHLTEIKQKVIESGVGTREEVRTTIEGESFFYDLIINPMRDSSGAVIGIQCISNDITERKQAEEALRRNEQFLDSILNSVQDGISVLGPNLTIRLVNGVMNEWYKEKLPLEGKKCYEVYQKLKKPCDSCPTLRCFESGKTESNIVPGSSGSTVKWIELFSFPIKDPDSHKVTGVVEFVRDITERKQAEEELRLNRILLRDILDIVPVFICAKNLDGKFILVNKKLTDFYGSTVEAMTNVSHADLCEDENELRAMLADDREVIESGKPKFIPEETMENPDGGITVLETYKIPFTALGEPVVLIASNDITERKQAETALKESEANYRNIVHDQTEYIMRYLPDGTRTFVNDSYCNAFNVSREEAVGTSFLQGVSKAAKAKLKNKIAILTPENQVISNEHESKSIDGNKIWRLWVDRGIFDEKGILKEIQATGRDITKRKLAEIARELALQEATAANAVKDQFVANISHEVRTPLNSILGFSDLLKQRYLETVSEKDRGIFGYITTAGDRLMRTVDSILNLSLIKAGTISIQKQELDLGLISTQAVEQLKLSAQNKHLDLKFSNPKKPQIIFADEYCIHQSILNLTDNAIKYTKEGTIELKFGHRDDQVVLSITDTGIGISDEYQKRLFDAYTQESEGFTKSYQGIGLGLALTKQYLELNDVELDFESKKNIGTTFTLTFPKYERGS